MFQEEETLLNKMEVTGQFYYDTITCVLGGRDAAERDGGDGSSVRGHAGPEHSAHTAAQGER